MEGGMSDMKSGMKKQISFLLCAVILLFSMCECALAQKAEYQFRRENFPVMDGSTACVPLGKAIAAVLLPGEENTEELVNFHKTTQSFRNLASGNCNLIISGQPEEAVFHEMADAGFQYEIKPIATDALIFVVNSENPVDNLTTEQIRDIYSGRITNWKEVGGADAPIAAFQRNPGAGSQALMLKLVMGDREMMDPIEGFVATEMGELMKAVKSYDNSANAIGYSVYYYANDMKKAEGLKILSVDGVMPSAKTIASGKYPHLNPYYAAISSAIPEDAPAAVLYSWLTSETGCKLMEMLGYVPVKADNELKYNVAADLRRAETEETTAKYTRLSDKFISDLSSRKDYGMLAPFHGAAFTQTVGETTYIAGYLNGMFDSKGRIVADAVYADVSLARSWSFDGEKAMPVWILKKADGEILEDYGDWQAVQDDSRYALAFCDGKIVTDCVYTGAYGLDDAVLAFRGPQGTDFIIYDVYGNELLREEDLKLPNRADEATHYYSVSKNKNTYTIGMEDGYYLVDAHGSVIAGPYDYINEFSEGYAVVSDYGNNSSLLMDEQGRIVLNYGSGRISPFRFGRAVIERDGIVSFIDKNLNTVFSVPGEYGTATEYGYQVDGAYYDMQGNLIFSAEGKPVWQEWNELLSSGLFYRIDGNGVTVYSYPRNEFMFFEGYSWATPFYTMTSSSQLPYFFLTKDNGSADWETLVCDSAFHVIWQGTGSAYALEDALTGKSYLCIIDGGTLTLYNTANEVVQKFTVRDDYVVPEIYNGIVILSETDMIRAYSIRNGKEFFAYPIGLWTQE